MLPGANCGGCGFAGCRGLADALVKRADISSLFCPVGGAEVMKTVAAYLGKAAPEKEPQVATVRCGGSCENVPGSMRTTVLRPARWLLRSMAEKRGVRTAAWDTGIV